MHSLDPPASAPGNGRLRLRVAAGLFAVFWGYVFFGLIDLLAFMDEAFHHVLLLETGWGLLLLFLVAAPLVAVAVRASAVFASALAEVVLVAVAVIAAAVLSSSAEHLLVAAGLFVTVATLAVLARDREWALIPKWRWSAVSGVLVILAVARAWHMRGRRHA